MHTNFINNLCVHLKSLAKKYLRFFEILNKYSASKKDYISLIIFQKLHFQKRIPLCNYN